VRSASFVLFFLFLEPREAVPANLHSVHYTANCEMGDDYELPKAVVNRLIKNAVQALDIPSIVQINFSFSFPIMYKYNKKPRMQ